MSISTQQLVGLVLGAAHERLQQRCDERKIIALLEDKHGAYDVSLYMYLLYADRCSLRALRHSCVVGTDFCLRRQGAASQFLSGTGKFTKFQRADF